ncbi:hypothetical protein Avbf_10350 [Armadillidium vulgare]|nr:hypothetical protein Avbf_10350 [Armadillidium vulgare]
MLSHFPTIMLAVLMNSEFLMKSNSTLVRYKLGMEFVLNRKKKKIPNIDFDLSQNILFYKNLVRLDHPSFVIFSSYYLKKLNILEALGEIDFEMEDILSDNNIISVIDNFVTKIQRNISKDFGIKLKLLDTYVKSSIFLVIERTSSNFSSKI